MKSSMYYPHGQWLCDALSLIRQGAWLFPRPQFQQASSGSGECHGPVLVVWRRITALVTTRLRPDRARFQRAGDVMTNKADRHVDQLNDWDLLERESQDRVEFLRLERMEPQSSSTSYRLIRGSRTLSDAWVRWTQSSVAARLRGLSFRNGA